jgi:hypothetical protein
MRIRIQPTQRTRCRDAVHAIQLDVHEHEIGMDARIGFQRARRAVHLVNHVRGLSQDTANQTAHVGIVFHH